MHTVDSLISVEYVPKKEKHCVQPLSGCIGETLSSFLKTNRKSDRKTIPVRFPLVGPNTHKYKIHSGMNNLCAYQLEIDGVDIVLKDICVLENKIPISLYKRISMREPQYLFERPVYMSTFSHKGMLGLLETIKSTYSKNWVWRLDSVETTSSRTGAHPPVFVEARVYGINNVISTYNKKKLDGVALEIIYKPWPSKKLMASGTQVLASCSDVYLFSNSDEYIDYVDGVNLRRERTTFSNILNKYKNILTPKQGVALRRENKYMVTSKLTSSVTTKITTKKQTITTKKQTLKNDFDYIMNYITREECK